MANERVLTTRNTGTEELQKWEVWYAITVADAVKLTDDPDDSRTIVDYVEQKIADLMGGAPAAYDTLKEIADYIAEHQDVYEALNTAIADKADKTVATTNTNGLMSRDDKIKLSGIENEANKYIHPATAGSKHLPAGGEVGNIIKWDADGTGRWEPEKTYGVASQSADGLISKADKQKLDGVAANANNYVHPASHPASMTVQDSTHRFVSDVEKNKWNSLPTIQFGTSYPASAPANSIFFLVRQ